MDDIPPLTSLAVLVRRFKDKLPPDQMETGVLMLLSEIGNRAGPDMAEAAIRKVADLACENWKELCDAGPGVQLPVYHGGRRRT